LVSAARVYSAFFEILRLAVKIQARSSDVKTVYQGSESLGGRKQKISVFFNIYPRIKMQSPTDSSNSATK